MWHFDLVNQTIDSDSVLIYTIFFLFCLNFLVDFLKNLYTINKLIELPNKFLKIKSKTNFDENTRTSTDIVWHLVRPNSERRISNCLRFFYTNKTHQQHRCWQHRSSIDVLDWMWKIGVVWPKKNRLRFKYQV